LNSELEKAIKNMRGKEATGDNCVPEDVFKLLGEDGLRLMTVMIKNKGPRIYVTKIALKKKPQASKSSNHRTCSKDSSEDTEKKTRNWICSWAAENNIRTNLGPDEELCNCFIDCPKAFDHVDQT